MQKQKTTTKDSTKKTAIKVINMTDFNEKKSILIERRKDGLIDSMRKKLGPQSLSKNDVESMNLMCDILIKGDVGERFLLLNYIQKVHNMVMKPRDEE